MSSLHLLLSFPPCAKFFPFSSSPFSRFCLFKALFWTPLLPFLLSLSEFVSISFYFSVPSCSPPVCFCFSQLSFTPVSVSQFLCVTFPVPCPLFLPTLTPHSPPPHSDWMRHFTGSHIFGSSEVKTHFLEFQERAWPWRIRRAERSLAREGSWSAVGALCAPTHTTQGRQADRACGQAWGLSRRNSRAHQDSDQRKRL